MTLKTVIGWLRERAKGAEFTDRRVMNEAARRLEGLEEVKELAYKTGFTEGYEAGLKAMREVLLDENRTKVDMGGGSGVVMR